MTHAGVVLLVSGAIVWGLGLFIFTIENERLPGRYLRWTVYQRSAGDSYRSEYGINVGVRRKQDHVQTAYVSAGAEDFTEQLAAAVAEARLKAVTLNGEMAHARRKLPR